MPLTASGQLKFSQIRDEFGGTGDLSLSDYYPLVGMGVVGLPSGAQNDEEFSFSDFHGKSNQVSRTEEEEVPMHLGTRYNWTAIPTTQAVVIFGSLASYPSPPEQAGFSSLSGWKMVQGGTTFTLGAGSSGGYFWTSSRTPAQPNISGGTKAVYSFPIDGWDAYTSYTIITVTVSI